MPTRRPSDMAVDSSVLINAMFVDVDDDHDADSTSICAHIFTQSVQMNIIRSGSVSVVTELSGREERTSGVEYGME